MQYDIIKHIEIDPHCIKEKNDSGQMCILYACFQNNLVHLLTKGLNTNNFERIVCKLEMENVYSLA